MVDTAVQLPVSDVAVQESPVNVPCGITFLEIWRPLQEHCTLVLLPFTHTAIDFVDGVGPTSSFEPSDRVKIK